MVIWRHRCSNPIERIFPRSNSTIVVSLLLIREDMTTACDVTCEHKAANDEPWQPRLS